MHLCTNKCDLAHSFFVYYKTLNCKMSKPNIKLFYLRSEAFTMLNDCQLMVLSEHSSDAYTI